VLAVVLYYLIDALLRQLVAWQPVTLSVEA
jgi:hypothetical protein